MINKFIQALESAGFTYMGDDEIEHIQGYAFSGRIVPSKNRITSKYINDDSVLYTVSYYSHKDTLFNYTVTYPADENRYYPYTTNIFKVESDEDSNLSIEFINETFLPKHRSKRINQILND